VEALTRLYFATLPLFLPPRKTPRSRLDRPGRFIKKGSRGAARYT
jgi:hypothetical protein